MTTFRTVELSDPRFEHEGLRFLTVKSASLKGRADLTLWIPPAERMAGLVILLHGVYGSHWAWALKGGAHRTAACLLSSREIPPFVLAMPSDGLWGDGSGYLPHATRDYERWIVEEVPAAVRQVEPRLETSVPLCIAGLSMGGFGALRLAAKHPRRFRAVSGHSSITHFDQLSAFVEEPLVAYGCPEEDRSVLEAFRRGRGPWPALRFDCGTEDPLLDANRALHQGLKEGGIAHEYKEFSGGHTWPYWEAHLVDTLVFFARACRASATEPVT